MKTRAIVAWAATAVMSCGFLVTLAGPASAHEARTVGPYHFLVGFGDEPPYVGQKNSVQLVLSRGGKPVTTLTDTLKVEVIFGSQKTTLSLEPTFDPDTGLGTPGDYRAWFIPTAAGPYTFHFTGTIGSQHIDQSFTSGPQTFAEVNDPAAVEFPVKPPTTVDLATRVVQDAARQSAAIVAAERAAKHDASGARTLAVVGIVVGAIGLAAGISGLLAARRARSRLAGPPPVPARAAEGS